MAYGRVSPISVSAPPGSHTDFTFKLYGTLADLKTVANGGYVQNTVVSPAGITCPADLIISTSVGGSPVSSFGWVKYVATTGEYEINVKIASYTAGMTLYALFGDAAVVTYQGGTRGAEFDPSFRIAYPFPDGTTLNVKDWTSNALDVSLNSNGVVGSGKIDGGISMSGSSSYLSIPTTSIATNITTEAWVNSSTLTSQNGVIWEKIPVNSQWMMFFEGGSLKMRGAGTGSDVTAAAPSNSAWHHVAAVFAGTSGTLYIDGAQVATGTIIAPANAANGLIIGAYGTGGGVYNFTGSIDEACLHATNRSADWVATRYANLNSPATIGASSPPSSGVSQLACLGAG